MSAYHLTKSGLKVLMLEAGRDYDPVAETPMYQTNAEAPLRGVSTPERMGAECPSPTRPAGRTPTGP